MQISLFSDQEIVNVQNSGDDLELYELHYLGLIVSGFQSINKAKLNVPQFTKGVLNSLSTLISQ
jgi:hypothetical protein